MLLLEVGRLNIFARADTLPVEVVFTLRVLVLVASVVSVVTA